MWVPERFALTDAQSRDALAHVGAADLLTPTPAGIEATFLPLVFHADAGERGVLRGHLARQNPHADALRADPTATSLVIAHLTDAYVSPTWYLSKATNPRTVPTWNYTVVHAHGTVRLHDDPDWVLDHLRTLSDHFEAGLPSPWSLDDAPADYVAGMARAVVGVELVIDRVEGKAKQSQNKSPQDVAGVAAGLRAQGADTAADALEAANRGKAWPPPRLRYR